MAPQPEVAIAAAYTARYNRLRVTAGEKAGRAWDRLANLDDSAAQRFAETAAGLSLGAQTQMAATVDGYVALMLGTTTGAGSPVGLDTREVSGAAVRAGAEPEDVYMRPVITARAAVSEGRSWAEGMALGRVRAVVTAEFDVALTQRASALQAIGPNDRIVGYRRTLTGASCTLCQVASTQRYHKGNLMPIHGHCDCGWAPIIGDSDPGHVINRDLLNDLKKRGEVDKITRQRALPKAQQSLDNAKGRVDRLRKEIRAETDQERETRLEKRLDRWRQEVTKREQRVADLRTERQAPRVATREHGELGPILTDASHSFTGAGDLAA